MRAALEEAQARGLVGANMLGSGYSVSRRPASGRRAPTSAARRPDCSSRSRASAASRARSRRSRPSRGLYAAPTLINNVETLATVPKILELGGERYGELGVENSTGTRVFSLSGNVSTARQLRAASWERACASSSSSIGGGVPDGRELKAIIPGGSSVPVLTAAEVDTALDFDAMAKAGSMLGSGAVIVIDDRCCMVQLGLRVAQFYQHESCGKCTPCREGVRWMVDILERHRAGRGAEQGELDLLLSVCDRMLGKCLCPLGDAAAMPVASYVAKFREEYQRHIDEGGCPFDGESSLEGLVAPVISTTTRSAQIDIPVFDVSAA